MIKMKAAVIYARVSSTGERQSTARQLADLTNYANLNGLSVVGVYEEHISGAKRNEERAVLESVSTMQLPTALRWCYFRS